MTGPMNSFGEGRSQLQEPNMEKARRMDTLALVLLIKHSQPGDQVGSVGS